METTPPPLRILVIVNLPWDERLGASRVWMELAEQWRAMGHTVEKFSLSDAFPGVRATRITFAFRQLIFIRKAAAFVRANGHRFDIIDALIGTLPFSKEALGFRGVIVARSVGLYRLYDRFERSMAQRWPQPRRGKLAGRLLYGLARRQLWRASEAAVRQADLINLPNEEEAACLREEANAAGRLLVQPYGLTDDRRRALATGATCAAHRLAQRRICFIGMWSARKGAHDWARIIERVRARVPDAQFRFLGTMIDAQVIRAELGPAAFAGVELISDYQPDELPALLADCAAGAFPSYVEGFGLAVLEQLAAGIPTVAYDTAGPRDLLQKRLPELLVPSGDLDRFAAALGDILLLGPEPYAQLSEKSMATAAEFSWPTIAHDTLQAYRALLESSSRPIVFVQPFSLGSAGGGARILRALLSHAPFAWRSVCCSPEKPKPWRNETHLRSRPFWGRIEHTRLSRFPYASARFFTRGFRKRLRRFCLRVGARAIHAVPHAGLDFAEAQTVARELSLPFFISLHDDLAYTAFVSPARRDAAMATAWREASARFVISEALGREYCRRYGTQEFLVVTDGVEHLSPLRTASEANVLRLYFMGLFHMGYERNLAALLQGIAIFERTHPSVQVSLTLRCEHVRAQVLAGARQVTVLPFADEAQVARDLEQADLLYLPIPFGEEHERFARYSLSTKMVTYAGSGVPILYHGPTTSAAFDLLQQHRAALMVTSLDAEEMARVFAEASTGRRAKVAANALALAEREFMLRDQADRFWGTIASSLTTA